MSAALLLLVAAPIQVAIVYDTGITVPQSGTRRWYSEGPRQLPDRIRDELTAFEEALRAQGAAPELAVVTCDGDPQKLVDRKFDLTVGDLPAWLDLMANGSIACAPGADAIDFAIESFDWSARDKRILILGEFGQFKMTGRATAEEAVHRAERAGIVVHALEFYFDDVPRTSSDAIAQKLAAEAHAFLERPTAPLGRVPSQTRHATLLSGGSYFLGPARSSDPRDQRLHRQRFGKPETAEAFAARWKQLTSPAKMYARGAKGSDGLDDLADGRRRVSEVAQNELPEKLQNLDLEPLLDPIWNYVDARRTLARLHGETMKLIEVPIPKGGALGRALAKAMVGPRRLPPSRR